MKKRKSILLQIATLCLCVAAIAFGVYSAKTASLNVSGTIGFEAHNCNVSIATTITGAATQDFGDKTTITKDAVTINATSESTKTGTLNLGNLFFTDKDTANDKAAPIKMTFAITNNSAFAIKASVSFPTTSSGVTILADKDSIRIGNETNKNTGSITVTFTLDNPEASLTDSLNLSGLALNFEKYDKTKADIPVKYKADGLLSNYYIEYGTGKVGSTTYPINWYIIGKYVNNEITALGSDDLTPVTANTTYKMKDTITYAFMSENILTSGGGTTNETKYVPFNNNVFKNSSDEYYSNEYTSVLANDYSISTIRAYLNGKTVNTATDTSTSNIWKPNTATDKATNLNFFTQNTLKDNDIYTLIQPRTLGDMYKKMSDSSTDLTPPTAVEGISATDADAFWLLSYNEASTLWTSETNRVGNILLPKNGDMSSYSMSVYVWFLRSPSSSYFDTVRLVDPMGGFASNRVYGSCGVRAAFLI